MGGIITRKKMLFLIKGNKETMLEPNSTRLLNFDLEKKLKERKIGTDYGYCRVHHGTYSLKWRRMAIVKRDFNGPLRGDWGTFH